MSADIFPELDQSNGTKIQGIWGTQENGKAVICNIISQFNIKDRTRIEAYAMVIPGKELLVILGRDFRKRRGNTGFDCTNDRVWVE